jgi:hypothetical protein
MAASIPNQIAALFFGKDDRADVGQVNDHVNQHEGRVGVLRGHFFQRRAILEAHHDQRVSARFGQTQSELHALRFGGDFDIAVRAAGFRLPLFGTVIGRFVEGFVELAAHVEHQRGVCIGCDSRQGQRRGRTA